MDPPSLEDDSDARPFPTTSLHKAKQPDMPFEYDVELLALCERLIRAKDHHGLALVARQKGIPPFLRSKVWPLLLKSHPFVLNPYITPDIMETPSDDEADPDRTHNRISFDLRRYIKRSSAIKADKLLSETETQLFDILEHAVKKFLRKWGELINYSPGLTWIALGLAEWVPPIPDTNFVLVGRSTACTGESVCIRDLTEEYASYITQFPSLAELLSAPGSGMAFADLYERLVLVLLHAPEPSEEPEALETLTDPATGSIPPPPYSSTTADLHSTPTISPYVTPVASLYTSKATLPVNGGTTDERISLFVYSLRRLLPELANYFNQEQVLNGLGGSSSDDEWIIWWLKWCGAKVWTRQDRGAVWDMMLGWRVYTEADADTTMEISPVCLAKLGLDVFWSPVVHDEDVFETQSEDEFEAKIGPNTMRPSRNTRRNSFKTLMSSLTIKPRKKDVLLKMPVSLKLRLTAPAESARVSAQDVPCSKLDPHIELLFVSLSFLKTKESMLVELDQNEIREFLSRAIPRRPYMPVRSSSSGSNGASDVSPPRTYTDSQASSPTASHPSTPLIDSAHSSVDMTPLSLSNVQAHTHELARQFETTDDMLYATSPRSVASTTVMTAASGSGHHRKHKPKLDSISKAKFDVTKQVNYPIGKVLNEAGELWRTWLWKEMSEGSGERRYAR